MTIKYTARSGRIYFLHVAPGSKGKVKYFFSTKGEGPLAQVIPEGYEIYENVNAQVFLRRKVVQIIRDDEITLVQKALLKHAETWRYKAEIKKNMIVIHQACKDYDWVSTSIPWLDESKMEERKKENTRYMPVMRFILADGERRLFAPERYCFRGNIDDWITIGCGAAPLGKLAKKYIKHLGRDSFYELI